MDYRSSTINIGQTERIGSAIAGAVLVARAVAHPSLARIIMAIGGAALLQRGLTGHCSMYRALGIETTGRAKLSRRHALIDDPVGSASEDSFPASDPPSWTPVSGSGAAHRQ